jgi:hypothetical protein
MEIMETIWPIVGVVVPLLGAWAGVMVSIPHPNYRFARGLLIGAAVILGGTDLTWQLTTDKPAWFRVVAGSLTAIALCWILPKLLEWAHRQESHD